MTPSTGSSAGRPRWRASAPSRRRASCGRSAGSEGWSRSSATASTTRSPPVKYVLMGTSSNLGNMISAAGASVPGLPADAAQPDPAQQPALRHQPARHPTDEVDPEQLTRPAHWDVGFVRRFMLVFGPISSLFDVLTFVVMLRVFSAGPALFRSGWFVESLATQTLVIFAVRTRRVPFWRSRPSRAAAPVRARRGRRRRRPTLHAARAGAGLPAAARRVLRRPRRLRRRVPDAHRRREVVVLRPGVAARPHDGAAVGPRAAGAPARLPFRRQRGDATTLVRPTAQTGQGCTDSAALDQTAEVWCNVRTRCGGGERPASTRAKGVRQWRQPGLSRRDRRCGRPPPSSRRSCSFLRPTASGPTPAPRRGGRRRPASSRPPGRRRPDGAG